MLSFYSAIFDDAQYNLGAATASAAVELLGYNSGYSELVATYILFGDPATHLGVLPPAPNWKLYLRCGEPRAGRHPYSAAYARAGAAHLAGGRPALIAVEARACGRAAPRDAVRQHGGPAPSRVMLVVRQASACWCIAASGDHGKRRTAVLTQGDAQPPAGAAPRASPLGATRGGEWHAVDGRANGPVVRPVMGARGRRRVGRKLRRGAVRALTALRWRW
jgi:hypothetical protein